MARTYKTVGFSIPPQIVKRIEEITEQRNMTKSELFREMFRVWEKHDRRDLDSDEAIMRLFAEVKEEERKNPTPKEVDMAFYRELAKDLQRRAKERGLIITEDGEILEKAEV